MLGIAGMILGSLRHYQFRQGLIGNVHLTFIISVIMSLCVVKGVMVSLIVQYQKSKGMLLWVIDCFPYLNALYQRLNGLLSLLW
jgi:hypothetical protein